MMRYGFFADVWALTMPYWFSSKRKRGLVLLASVVGLTLGIVYVNVLLNLWNNDFYNAIQDKKLADFYRLLGKFTLLAGAFIIMAVYRLYLTQMLQIVWRTWLTDRYLEDWLADRAYYRLQLTDTGTDNPDQRIAEDLRLFVENTLSLVLGLLLSVATLVSFVAILWRLSGTLTVPLGATQVTVPGYMVWFALLYAIIGSWLTHKIGKPLIRLGFDQQRYEADFRFSLVRLREHSEGVALYHGESGELNGFKTRFAHVIGNWWAIMKRQKQLTWFTSGYAQVAIIFPFVVASPRYFSGAIQLGGLMQTASAFGQVQGALSWFIDAYTQFATWRATVNRLTGFTGAVARARAEAARLGQERVERPGPEVALEGLALAVPDGRPLLEPTSLTLTAGQNVLVSGPSGSGKSTLFRALAGLWPYRKGRIVLPAGARLLFLPQKAYLPIGSLKHAVAYPSPTEAFTDAEVKDALVAVGLAPLAEDLAHEENWGQVLSGGEQQRVAFARALVTRPDWLFMDEATASLPENAQRELYALLRERLTATTLVSIGHREGLAEFHPRQLRWLQGPPPQLVAG